MGFFSGRSEVEPRPEQKWDAISLRDFKSTSCFPTFAYGYLHFDILLSLAVYGVDTFTAINLLAFNTWSSSIEPTQIVPFDVSKWIFSACIIASFINLGFEHIRSMRVRKRGSVAECYLDNLAVRLESTRWGKGQGYRRFLVFAELTKSKKGAEYIALFTYFSFQAWIRVIFCSGPRQAINALTLYAVYTSELIPTDVSSVGSTLGDFFAKLGTLYDENNQQAIILSGMLFTLVVWAFTVLFLFIAVLFYVFFLWHYIPRQDGGLHGYCERKVNKRLMRIVMAKVNKAIEKEEEQKRKAEYKAALKAGEKPPVGRQATLPQLMGSDGDDKLPGMPLVSRTDTGNTLPPYTSRPGTPGSIELGAFDQKRPTPSRQGTDATSVTMNSISSRTPLVGGAAGMGFNRSASPAPSLPPIDFGNFPPARPGTASSNRSFGGSNTPLNRVATNSPAMGMPRTASPMYRTASPAPYASNAPPGAVDPYSRPMPRQVNQFSGRGYNGPVNSPLRSVTNPTSAPSPQQYQPQRNLTAPGRGEYYGPRPGPTANQRGLGYGYDDDIEAQRGYPRY